MKRIARLIALVVLAVLYFILPVDLLPDSLGRTGRIDDFILILIIVYYYFFKPFIDEITGKSKRGSDSSTNESECDTQNPWQILGVKPDASWQEIKTAYHDKIRQYHPDLVEKLGPEIQQLAREKSQKLNEAFEFLKNQQNQKKK